MRGRAGQGLRLGSRGGVGGAGLGGVRDRQKKWEGARHLCGMLRPLKLRSIPIDTDRQILISLH